MIPRSISKFYFLPLILLLSLLSVSCRHIDVFEKNVPIPRYKWDYNFKATGDFTITDTLSSYNIYIVLRHTDAYKYNNIWLNVGLQGPGDTMFYQKVKLDLGTDATGWEGTGMNDIWEVRKIISGLPRRFKKMGKYNCSISQVMRDNPLSDVMSVGLRVVKL